MWQKPELSLKEKERRWSLVREQMRKERLAAIILYGNSLHWVPIQYLTNITSAGPYPEVLLFPLEGDPVFVVGSPQLEFFAKKMFWVPEENIYCSVNLSAELAKHLIRLKLQNERVGIDSYKAWPVRDYRILRGLIPDVELVDATRLLGKIRGPKSSEEIKLIEEAVRINELAQRTFLANLKPGMKEQEVVAKVEEVVRANGVDRRIWLTSSSPEIPYPDLPGDIIIRRPNPVLFSAEFVRTRGYASQTVRTYCWEEPKGESKRMWAVQEELKRMVVNEIRPGREVTQLAKKVDDFVTESGFEFNYMGHAVGLNHSDLPYIVSTPSQPRYMEWTIMPNEVYVFHPMIRAKGGKPPLVFIGDMYFVGEEDTRCMTPFLSGMPEMIPG